MTWIDIPLIIADDGKTIRNKITGETAKMMAVFPSLSEYDFEEIDQEDNK